MRVLLVSNMYPSAEQPVYGLFVKRMEELLRRNGIDFDYVIIRGRGKNAFHKILKYTTFYLNFIKKFFSSYDTIYVHYPLHISFLILLLKPFRKRKLVLNLHGGDLLYNGFVGKVLGRINDRLLMKCHTIIVPSDYFRSLVIGRFGKELSDKIIVSPSGGVDNAIYFNEHRSTNKTFTLGYVGRIDEGKGWKEFLKIVENIDDQIIVKMVGHGTQYPLLEKKAKELKNEVFLLGAKFNEELGNFYRSIDLLCIPTQLPESLCLVALESLSCGTPVVASNIGAIPTYLKEGYNGYLLPKNDYNGFSRAIMSYKNLSPGQKNIFCSNAAESVKEFESSKSIFPILDSL